MTDVRLRVPNSRGTGPVWDYDEIAGVVGQTPLITNRHYVMDRATHGHVPLGSDGEGYRARITAAVGVTDAIIFTLDVSDPEMAALIGAHGDPAPGYVAHHFGFVAPEVKEVGLAPEVEPEPIKLKMVHWRHPRRGEIHEVVCDQHETHVLRALKALGIGCIGEYANGGTCGRCAADEAGKEHRFYLGLTGPIDTPART